MEPTPTSLNADKKDIEEQATTLIALLDRVYFLKGGTLTTHPERPDTAVPPLPIDGTPVAVQMYESPSLLDHLAAQEQEARENETLSTRIHDLSKLAPVTRAAHERLDAEYNALPDAIKQNHQRQQENKKAQNSRTASTSFHFPSQPLHHKIALLRPLQRLATKPPHPPEFITHVVTALDLYGRPNPLTHLHLPVATSWTDYAVHLTQCTQHWQSTENGCPDGYTLKEGKWLYRFVEIGKDVDDRVGLRVLGSENDYRGMRVELVGKGIGEFGVLVWHERVKGRSDTRRERKKETRELWGDLEGLVGCSDADAQSSPGKESEDRGVRLDAA